MSSMFFLLVFLTFLLLAVGGHAYYGGSEALHQDRVRRRLLGETILPPEESLLKSGGARRARGAGASLSSYTETLQNLMLQANLPWGMRGLLLFFLVCGTGGAALGFLARGAAAGLVGAGLALALAYRVLLFKKKLRVRKFEKQLSEALDLMARGMRAGHAFTGGFQMVAQEMPNPIAKEFLHTFSEYNHGLDLSLALLNLCQRVDLKDLKFFTTAVVIQRETGGNLAEILEKIATLIRERFKLRRQVKALTAEGRLSGLILILLTPATALVLFYLNPEYMRVLLTHPLGRTMALTALAFQGLGMLVIRKIVNIKV